MDDDELKAGLIISPNGYSEVTILIRHSRLRLIGERARLALYGPDASARTWMEKVSRAQAFLDELETLQLSSRLTPYPKNFYETREYFQINFHRERARISLGVTLLLSSDTPNPATKVSFLLISLKSASEMVMCYRTSMQCGFLVMNWTLVQDILRSGFTILYCGVQLLREIRLHPNAEAQPSNLDIPTLLEAINASCEMLAEISTRWETVKPHHVAFSRISEQVKSLLQRGAQQPNQQMSSSTVAGPSTLEGASSTEHDLDVFSTDLDLPQISDFGLSDAELSTIFGMDWSELALS